MNYRDKYNLWLTFDENTKSELLSVTDEKEIEDRLRTLPSAPAVFAALWAPAQTE